MTMMMMTTTNVTAASPKAAREIADTDYAL
jgi:hypothetical protein